MRTGQSNSDTKDLVERSLLLMHSALMRRAALDCLGESGASGKKRANGQRAVRYVLRRRASGPNAGAWPANPMVCDKLHISENFTFRMTLNEAKREPAAGERSLQFSLDITRSWEVLFAVKAVSNPEQWNPLKRQIVPAFVDTLD
jgi:hypothetical protein